MKLFSLNSYTESFAELYKAFLIKIKSNQPVVCQYTNELSVTNFIVITKYLQNDYDAAGILEISVTKEFKQVLV